MYKEYKDNNDNNNILIFSFIIYQGKGKLKLFCSSESEQGSYIKMWDFQSSELLKKIKIDSPNLRSICPIKENFLLVGCGDNSIKLIEIEKGLIINTFKGHKDKIFCIKMISFGNFGKCFLSHGYDNCIIFWHSNNN